jgi:hypothetical protein
MNIRFNPLGVESAGSPDQAVDFIPLREEKLGKVRAILPGNTSNQCAFQLGTSIWFIWFLGLICLFWLFGSPGWIGFRPPGFYFNPDRKKE